MKATLVADIGRSTAKLMFFDGDSSKNLSFASPIGMHFEEDKIVAFLLEIFETFPFERVVLSLAAMKSADQKRRLEELLTGSFSALEFFLYSDVDALLRATESANPRLVFISGTGSIIRGNHKEKEIRLLGFGPEKGDPGSAYSLSRKLLSHAQHHARRYPEKILLAKFSLFINRTVEDIETLEIHESAQFCRFLAQQSTLPAWVSAIIEEELQLLKPHLSAISDFSGTLFVEGGLLNWNLWKTRLIPFLQQKTPNATIKINEIDVVSFLTQIFASRTQLREQK